MKISQEKKEKIYEQILGFLFSSFPKNPFTAEIAREIARDEEYTKKLLQELKYQKFVVCISQNSEGIPFSRRLKWRLSSKVYNVYKNKQFQ